MKKFVRLAVLCLLAAFSATITGAQTTEFTYQGRLADSGQTATGNYDFEFRLFEAEAGGAEISVLQRLDVAVSNGIFSVKLDFGSNFNGQPRFLEIAARASGSQGSFVVLTPRQPLTSTPYSIKSLEANTATNATQLGGVDANQFVVTNDPRMTDERTPAPNSPNYIQNTSTQQTNSNFNISGDGSLGGTLSANTINATTQYNIGGQRAFTVTAADNIFAGVQTGQANTGSGNSFYGARTGISNTDGSNNSFFGFRAGQLNTTGVFNTYFGANAGLLNQTGRDNAVFGGDAGTFNRTGSQNTSVGNVAGRQNLGSNNSFFGFSAGSQIINGNNNTAVGANSVIFSPNENITVSNSTALGAGARVITTNAPLSFATAIGAGAEVRTDNTVVLGRNLDTVQIPGTLNVAGGVNFAGTLTANRINTATDIAVRGETVLKTLGNVSLFVGFGAGGTSGIGNTFVGNFSGASNTGGAANSFFGNSAGNANTLGGENTFVGTRAGEFNTVGSFNSFFGVNAGNSNTDGSENTFLGFNAGRLNTSGIDNVFVGHSAGRSNLTGNKNVFNGFGAGVINTTGGNNVFVGAEAGKTNVTGSNNTIIGNNSNVASADLTFATAIGAGAIVSSNNTIQIGRAADTVNVSGAMNVSSMNVTSFVTLQTLGLGGNQVLCRNGSLQIGICSSSLRYKTNINPFNSGLSLVNRLRPITFDWKSDGMKDLGLGAEEVAAVEPLLVNYNDKGEIEGVKYDRIGVILLNAIKEQQKQIEALTKLVCASNPTAEICTEKDK